MNRNSPLDSHLKLCGSGLVALRSRGWIVIVIVRAKEGNSPGQRRRVVVGVLQTWKSVWVETLVLPKQFVEDPFEVEEEWRS